MSDDTRQRAAELWQQGYQRQLHAFALARDEQEQAAAREMSAAVDLYSQSIEVCPTAEAHTFRGWAYQAFGQVDAAIAECKRAIEVDPDFGNPYNDIGAYLIEKGELDEAIDWLEKAKQARRYEPRHYPFMNLGRLYAAKGMIVRAIEELEEAVKLARDTDPSGEAATVIAAQIRGLRARLN